MIVYIYHTINNQNLVIIKEERDVKKQKNNILVEGFSRIQKWHQNIFHSIGNFNLKHFL